MAAEKTLIMIKPDAIERKLAGTILSYFENAGFGIVRLKKGRLSESIAVKLYRDTETQLTGMGNKTLESMTSAGFSDEIEKIFGSKEPYEIGKKLIQWTRKFMTSTDIIAMILEGDDAVRKGRELIGKTDPSKAEKGTIRGDFADDSILNANREGRATRNLVHASDSDGADIETKLFEKEFF